MTKLHSYPMMIAQKRILPTYLPWIMGLLSESKYISISQNQEFYF